MINTDAIVNELMTSTINNAVDKVRGLYFTKEIDGQEYLLLLLSKIQQSLASNIISLQDKITKLKNNVTIESETTNEQKK